MPLLIGRNETRSLGLMSAAAINSETAYPGAHTFSPLYSGMMIRCSKECILRDGSGAFEPPAPRQSRFSNSSTHLRVLEGSPGVLDPTAGQCRPSDRWRSTTPTSREMGAS
jgi:hypothetical protein